jgi:hypothetical protein
LNVHRSGGIRVSDSALLRKSMVANVLFLDEVSVTATNPT